MQRECRVDEAFVGEVFGERRANAKGMNAVETARAR